MLVHSPAIDRHRVLTHAAAPTHGVLRDHICATMHNLQSIVVTQVTATREGRITSWAAMQYAVAINDVHASHATMIYYVAPDQIHRFQHAWG